MGPQKFKKKPVIIEAMEWDQTKDALQRLNEWGAGASISAYETSASGKIVHNLRLKTLEGTLNVSDGDWIIRGIAGEFYPCKPDIFFATYETV